MYTKFLLTNNFLPLNFISSRSVTLHAGCKTTASFTFTLPSLIKVTASLLLQTPQCAKNLFKGIGANGTSFTLPPEIVFTGGFGTGAAYSLLISTIVLTCSKLVSIDFIFSSFLSWILLMTAFTDVVVVGGLGAVPFLSATFKRLFSSKRLSIAMERSFFAFFFACLNSSLIKLFFFFGTNFWNGT